MQAFRFFSDIIEIDQKPHRYIAFFQRMLIMKLLHCSRVCHTSRETQFSNGANHKLLRQAREKLISEMRRVISHKNSQTSSSSLSSSCIAQLLLSNIPHASWHWVTKASISHLPDEIKLLVAMLGLTRVRRKDPGLKGAKWNGGGMLCKGSPQEHKTV